MPRIIVFYFEWPNVRGNHTGMAYFAECLKKYSRSEVKLIRTLRKYSSWREIVKRLWRESVIKYIRFVLQPDDIFLFMEYINPSQVPGDHCAIASDLRKKGVNNKFIGLVHLPGRVLMENLGKDYIQSAVSNVDLIVVMGSNLARFFDELGCGNKVKLTFHYVDDHFYRPAKKKANKKNIVVIASGYLFRNTIMLAEIIKQCPDITFDICMGYMKLDPMFNKFQNAIINKFLPEEEILKKMQQADASLSVFDDTVGSNVIVTSLACGLPQVVSDVGAIRDYCSEENAIFCKTVDEYVQAIHFLSQNREKCLQMGLSARKKAEEISLEKSIRWYDELFKSLA